MLRKGRIFWQQGEKFSRYFRWQCIPWPWFLCFVPPKCIPLSFVYEHVTHFSKVSISMSMNQECSHKCHSRPAVAICRATSWATPAPRGTGESWCTCMWTPSPLTQTLSTHMPHCLSQAWRQDLILWSVIIFRRTVLRRGLGTIWKQPSLSGDRILESWYPVCGDRRKKKILVKQVPLTLWIPHSMRKWGICKEALGSGQDQATSKHTLS